VNRKFILPVLLLLLLAACASTQPLAGRYAVVPDRELTASRWEVEKLVGELREQLGDVDLVVGPTGADYDAVILLDLRHARGISKINYEIVAGERTKKGDVLVGRTTQDVIRREYPPDHETEAAAKMRISAPYNERYAGWHRLPPAGQVQTLAGMIIRDLERMR
jgi:hypothetical protein